MFHLKDRPSQKNEISRKIPRNYRKYGTPAVSSYSQSGPDLRLVIARHAERMDTTYGDDWYMKFFGNNPTAPSQLYRNPALPQGLPHRSPTFHYILDPPITRAGQGKSFLYGRQLLSKVGPVDFCYASPASRCVLTADAILQGMNQSKYPIRLEPNLFEPINWNTALQGFSNIHPFMSRSNWERAGYNIDRSYQPVSYDVHLLDNEREYYGRSQYVFQQVLNLFRREGFSRHGRPATILIVGHSASPIIFPTIAKREAFDVTTFNNKCANSQFLDTSIIERDATTKRWRQVAEYRPALQM